MDLDWVAFFVDGLDKDDPAFGQKKHFFKEYVDTIRADSDLARLVWAKDFAEQVRTRGERRLNDAKTRQTNSAENDDGKDREDLKSVLKAALAQ